MAQKHSEMTYYITSHLIYDLIWFSLKTNNNQTKELFKSLYGSVAHSAKRFDMLTIPDSMRLHIFGEFIHNSDWSLLETPVREADGLALKVVRRWWAETSGWVISDAAAGTAQQVCWLITSAWMNAAWIFPRWWQKFKCQCDKRWSRRFLLSFGGKRKEGSQLCER